MHHGGALKIVCSYYNLNNLKTSKIKLQYLINVLKKKIFFYGIFISLSDENLKLATKFEFPQRTCMVKPH